jgi:hypothetical protein
MQYREVFVKAKRDFDVLYNVSDYPITMVDFLLNYSIRRVSPRVSVDVVSPREMSPDDRLLQVVVDQVAITAAMMMTIHHQAAMAALLPVLLGEEKLHPRLPERRQLPKRRQRSRKQKRRRRRLQRREQRRLRRRRLNPLPVSPDSTLLLLCNLTRESFQVQACLCLP